MLSNCFSVDIVAAEVIPGWVGAKGEGPFTEDGLEGIGYSSFKPKDSESLKRNNYGGIKHAYSTRKKMV